MKVRDLKALLAPLPDDDDIAIFFTDEIGDERLGEITDIGWDASIDSQVIRAEENVEDDEEDDEIEPE